MVLFSGRLVCRHPRYCCHPFKGFIHPPIHSSTKKRILQRSLHFWEDRGYIIGSLSLSTSKWMHEGVQAEEVDDDDGGGVVVVLIIAVGMATPVLLVLLVRRP